MGFPRPGPQSTFTGTSLPERRTEALTATRPYAVDVASGVEAAPGVKDPYRLQAFFEAVGSASAAPQP